MDCSLPGPSVHGMDVPGKNTGMGCHFLSQAIFPTEGSNPSLLCFLHWQAGSLPLSRQGVSPLQVPPCHQIRGMSPAMPAVRGPPAGRGAAVPKSGTYSEAGIRLVITARKLVSRAHSVFRKHLRASNLLLLSSFHTYLNPRKH